MNKKLNCLVILLLVIAGLLIGCNKSTDSPEKAAEAYLNNQTGLYGYNFKVTKSEIKAQGDVNYAKELYAESVEDINDISDFAIVQLKIDYTNSNGDTMEGIDFEIDCIKDKDEWKAMGFHINTKTEAGRN